MNSIYYLRRCFFHSIDLFRRSSIQRIGLNSGGIIKKWERNIVIFANLSNIVCLMGGSLKREQIISGLMSDLFSNCYLSQAVIWDYEMRGLSNHRSEKLVLEELDREFTDSLDKLKCHLPRYLSLLARISCDSRKHESILMVDDVKYLSNLLWIDNNIRSHFESQILIDSGVIKDIRDANDTECDEIRSKLTSRIISVGESDLDVVIHKDL